jgi:GH25 family lysozyme M1 (1,4-beta-N-acetylmuramidase)
MWLAGVRSVRADPRPTAQPDAEPADRRDHVTAEGSDLSHWNGFDLSGCDFCFLKASQGGGYTDPDFASRWKTLRASDVVAGAYHFLDGTATGKAQAQRFLDVVQPAEGEILVGDWEWFTPEASFAVAADFFETLASEAPTNRLGLYTVDTFSDPRGGAGLAEIADLWFVQWGGHGICKGWSAWTFKQTGTWKNGVDHDLFNGSVDDLNDYAGGTMDQKTFDALHKTSHGLGADSDRLEEMADSSLGFSDAAHNKPKPTDPERGLAWDKANEPGPEGPPGKDGAPGKDGDKGEKGDAAELPPGATLVVQP